MMNLIEFRSRSRLSAKAKEFAFSFLIDLMNLYKKINHLCKECNLCMGSLVCIPLLILYDILYNMFFADKKNNN